MRGRAGELLRQGRREHLRRQGEPQGGYSREYVLREKFAFPLPDGLDPAAAAPLMCASITVWEPMLAAGVGEGARMAVAGLGGLGHLAVKLGVALGATVTVLSRTEDKREDALGLGAVDLLVSTDDAQLMKAAGASISSSTPSPPTTNCRRYYGCSASIAHCVHWETRSSSAAGCSNSSTVARS